MNKIFKFLKKVQLYKDFHKFKKFNDDRLIISWKDKFLCMDDNTSQTEFDKHYIYHTAWAARKLLMIKPDIHYDFSSSLFFISIVSSWQKMVFFDYRPVDLQLDNLTCKGIDLVNTGIASDTLESISCMHVLEHIGLGRYGDPIDPRGDIKAAKELIRILKVNGSVLIVVPVGAPKIQFNAHRIYSYELILSMFSELELQEFALIPSNSRDGIIYNPDLKMINEQEYGCGCFWFKK